MVRQTTAAAAESDAAAAGESVASPPPEAPARPKAYHVPEMVSKSVISYPSQGALIERPRVVDADGQTVNMLVRGERYFYTFDVAFSAVSFQVRFGMMIKTLSGVELGGASSGTEAGLLPIVEAGTTLTVRLAFECRLLPGVYFLNAGVSGIVGEERRFLHRLVDACLFRVQDESDLPTSGFVDFAVAAEITEAGNHLTKP